MAKARTRHEWAYPCPRCKAPVDTPCRSSVGEVIYNMHAARRMLARGEEVVPGHRWRGRQVNRVDVCQARLVGCWRRGCTDTPADCEFCGVCNDAECQRVHIAG